MVPKMERKQRSALVTVAVAFALMSPSSAGLAYERPGTTERVTLSSQGEIHEPLWPAEGSRNVQAISSDGRYVAFESSAPNLVPGDTNLVNDVFVRDRRTAKTSRVSVSSSGEEALGACGKSPQQVADGGLDQLLRNPASPSVDASGRFIAFTSCAVNLVPSDTNLSPDVFLHDLKSGQTVRVSVNSRGEQAEGPPPPSLRSLTSSNSISGDGRFVSFMSTADNLVSNDSNDEWDAFLHDLKTGRTERVSVATNGDQAAGGLSSAEESSPGDGISINANGRFVTFTSQAPNLVADDTNRAQDCFVHDRLNGTTQLVNRAVDGSPTTLSADLCSISGDGRFVAFASKSFDLVPSDSNLTKGIPGNQDMDVFVVDLRTRRTERVSVSSTGGEGLDSGGPGIDVSADGRYVAFASRSGTFSMRDTYSTLPLEGYTDNFDIYVYDRSMGSIELVSLDRNGKVDPTQPSESPSISGNGRFVSFQSFANLDGGDEGRQDQDVFVRDRGSVLGVGGDGTGPHAPQGSSPPICLTGGVCVPPNRVYQVFGRSGQTDGSAQTRSARIFGASIAHRSRNGDLFVTIEAERMSGLGIGVPEVIGASSRLSSVYGLRFRTGATRYEIRAARLPTETFGLFRCTTNEKCTEVTDLLGGYGTTGQRVVVSLPLDVVGLQHGGGLEHVEVFSAVGTYAGGPVRFLDRLRIR